MATRTTTDLKRVFAAARARHLEDATANLTRLMRLQDDALLFLAEEVRKLPDARVGTDWTKAQLRTFSAIDARLSSLRTDYAALLLLATESSAQNAADLQAEAASVAGLPPDPSLAPVQSRKTTLNDGAEIVAIFSHTADNAARTAADRAYSDGKRLYERLAALDGDTRRIVERIVSQGLAAGLPSGEVADKLLLALGERGVQTPRYMAQRLAVTEIAKANRTAAVLAALNPGTGRLKQGVIGLRWNLSLSHSVTDECDDHASASSPGLPSGVYLPDDVPDEHPNGMCYLTPEFAGASE